MILVNVYFSLRRLSVSFLKKLCENSLPMVERTVKPWAAQAAAQLTRVAGNTVRSVVSRLAAARWEAPPVAGPSAASVSPPAAPELKRDKGQIMEFLVSQILANAYEAGTDVELQRRLARLEQFDIDCGDKYHSTQFFQLVEFLGAEVKMLLDSHDIHEPLPGIGLPSHYSFLCADLAVSVPAVDC
jgi:hypothetical protein